MWTWKYYTESNSKGKNLRLFKKHTTALFTTLLEIFCELIVNFTSKWVTNKSHRNLNVKLTGK